MEFSVVVFVFKSVNFGEVCVVEYLDCYRGIVLRFFKEYWVFDLEIGWINFCVFWSFVF